jgi:choline-sulfatase
VSKFWQMAAALSLGLGTLVPGVVAAAAPRRPNVVFICTDDQARWAVAAYGNPEIVTPNLDRLAREGALFRNAFTVTPVCSPSRASLMTSRYSTQFGIADWIDPDKEPNLGLAPSAVLWPELLKAHGYATALLGKWHLGTQPEFHPTRQGYDHFFGFLNGGNRPIDPRLEVQGALQDLKGSLPDLLIDEAIRYVDAHREGPFLLSVHFREPHAPYAPVPPEDSEPYRTLDPTIPSYPGLPVARVKQLTREYYASVHAVDRNVGRLLDRLDALGLTGDTIVFFTSDHGYMIGHHGLHHKGNGIWIAEGQKGPRPNMFDDSIRVPLLVRWPGVVQAGATIDAVVSNLDIFPTVLDLVGLGVPDNLKIEGRSFAPLLRGESIPWDDTLFGQYDMHHTKDARMRMIRTPDWKLIRHLEPGGTDELYHIAPASDPGETENLADSPAHAEQLKKLDDRLKQWMRSITDPVEDKEGSPQRHRGHRE